MILSGSSTQSISYDNSVDFKVSTNSMTSSNATINLQGPNRHTVDVNLNGELRVHLPDGLYTYSAIDLFGNTASGTFSTPTTATVSIPSDPISQHEYYLRQILPDNSGATPEQRDGGSLVDFNRALWLFFGWNPILFAGTNNNCAQVWKSTDEGLTWVAQPDAPLVSAEQIMRIRNDGKIWTWNTPGHTTYTFDGTNWELKSSSNYTTKIGGVRIFHKNNMYTIGGQLTVDGSPINDTSVYMSTGGAFTKISDIDDNLWLTTGDDKGFRAISRTNGTQITTTRGVSQNTQSNNVIGYTSAYFAMCGIYPTAGVNALISIGGAGSGYVDMLKLKTRIETYLTARNIDFS